MADREESDWKRRIHAEADAVKPPVPVTEYFAPADSNRPVLRREVLSVIDFWHRRRRTRQWWFKLLRRVQLFFKGRTTVVIVQPPGPGGENGDKPSMLVKP